MTRPRRRVFLGFLATSLASALAAAEVIYLNNGDVIHGTLVAANNTEVTLKTPYGDLVVPKKDIERIDYEGAGGGGAASGRPSDDLPETKTPEPTAPPKDGGRAAITLQIMGRSFWYAFESPLEGAADPSIRLRVYVGSDRACTFVDQKPDTVDGATLYNSFTFSPTDSQLLESREGYECKVEKAQDGAVVLRLLLPPGTTGLQVVRMLYEINEGSVATPRWIDAVSPSFSIEAAPGKEAVVALEQNPDALEYSGFFKKKMKNVDQFKISVLSTELKD